MKKQKNPFYYLWRTSFIIFAPVALLFVIWTIFPQQVSALTASQLDAQATKSCTENRFGGARLEDCKMGYKWGYNGEDIQKCEDKYPVANKPRENASCMGGYKFGSDAAKKEDPTQDPDNTTQQSAAQKFCDKSEYNDSEQRECRRGYTERLKGSPVSVCSSVSGDLFRACETGWKEADRIKDAAADEKEAQQACSEKYSGNQAKIDACKAGYIGQSSGKDQTEACKNVSDKTTCEAGFVLANSTTGGGGEEEAQPDCDVKLSSPISWIICPIVDAAAGFSDIMFKQVISPLLEDVPVSTDPSDNAYKVWQNFRILANILLVGTLLVVVYAQIKGGR